MKASPLPLAALALALLTSPSADAQIQRHGQFPQTTVSCSAEAFITTRRVVGTFSRTTRTGSQILTRVLLQQACDAALNQCAAKLTPRIRQWARCRVTDRSS